MNSDILKKKSTKKLVSLCLVIATLLSYTIIAHRHFKLEPKLLLNFLKPQAGEMSALPQIAIDIKTLVHQYDISKFQLSNELKEQTMIYQRIIEFTYPAREQKSQFLFTTRENNQLNCRKIDQLHEALLYECK